MKSPTLKKIVHRCWSRLNVEKRGNHGWQATIKCLKRTETSGGVLGGVVPIFGQVEETEPMARSFSDETTQISLDTSVNYLYFTIRLRVVGTAELE
ncbi:hypothetical protein Scep_017015 [Stephania cephalantha]|uniref:Uncharacterized protein n=1 Tax=Stephania cephalantha TaxID=152367 RepID=A0AAP0IQN5_9MAGN